MIKYYQKSCCENSKSLKTKYYVPNYARYTTLKIIIFYGLRWGRMTVMRMSKQNSDLQLAYQNHDTRNF